MEDFLLSHSIFKKYQDRLFITPYAKCIHKASKEGRMEGVDKKAHLRWCRKYVWTKLFGLKGLFIYSWQNIGILIIDSITKILNIVKKQNNS